MSPRHAAYGCLLALGPLVAPACSPTDVPIGEADNARAGEGGSSALAGTSAAGASAPTNEAGSIASGNASGAASAQAGAGDNPSSVGGSGADPGGAPGAAVAGSGDAGAAPADCSATFGAALVKDCTTAADCVLANHNDCCGQVVTAIKQGTTTSFAAADQTYQACEPGCDVRGCFHPDMAEDGGQLASVGDAFAAVCRSSRCISTVVSGSSQCSVDADCTAGLVCVAFVTHTGATSSTKRECQNNPCNNITASCGCGSGICTSAGFPLCSTSGTQLVCDDGRQ